MTRQDVFYKDREYISHTYQRFPVAIISFHLQKGSGMWRRTIDGNCRRCAREIVEKEIIYE